MSITLQALEAAFQPIEEVGRSELSFPLNGVSITLRMPLPEEEAEAQRWASELLDSDKDAPMSAYLERLKVGMLSYSLVQVGTMDLRNVKTIPTGQVLPTGVPMVMERHRVMRDLVLRWNGLLRTAVWKKLIELSEQAEKEIMDAIQFTPSDSEAEIERLELRLQDLKEAKESMTALKPSERLRRLDDVPQPQVVPASPAHVPQPEMNLAELEEEEPMEEYHPAPPVQPQPKILRQPFSPVGGSPPTRTQALDQPLPTHTPTQPTQPRMDADSFVDTSDPSAMGDAYDAENRRILEMRRVQEQQRRQQQQSAVLRRPPPHLDAIEAASSVVERGNLNGIPVFEMPTQVLGDPHEVLPPAAPPINNAPAGAHNPRYRRNS